MVTVTKRCYSNIRTTKFCIGINVVNARNTGAVLDTVELHPGGLFQQLGEVVAIAGVLNHSGQGEQVVTRLQPSAIKSIQVHISSHMNFIGVSWRLESCVQ